MITSVSGIVADHNNYVLRLARSGSPERAWALMEQHGLLNSDSDIKALTLQARLVKDRAKRAKSAESKRLFTEAADLYSKAGRIGKSSYPIINAATMSLLAGDTVRSEALAREVLSLIAADPNEGETPYWRDATQAEALLLLGKEAEASDALRQAFAKQPEAWEDHAATLRQFGLILSHQGRDMDWLDSYRPPISVHFSGLSGLSFEKSGIDEPIRHFITTENPGFAYGALAAGADLIFAQAFLEHRDAISPCAELHAILPLPIDQFRETSVRAFGENWVPMFDFVLGQAATVTVLGLDSPPLLLAVENSDRVAMGRAVRNAQVLESRAVGVTVAAHGEPLRQQLTCWRNSGRPLTIIETQRETAVTGSVISGVSGQRLTALIWVNCGNKMDLLSNLGGQYSMQAYGSGHWLACNDVSESFRVGIQIALSDKGMRVSVLLAIFDPNAPSAKLLQRAEALAEASSHGVVSADDCSAMALVLENWSGSIDEMGELKTAWGSEDVWSVRGL